MPMNTQPARGVVFRRVRRWKNGIGVEGEIAGLGMLRLWRAVKEGGMRR